MMQAAAAVRRSAPALGGASGQQRTTCHACGQRAAVQRRMDTSAQGAPADFKLQLDGSIERPQPHDAQATLAAAHEARQRVPDRPTQLWYGVTLTRSVLLPASGSTSCSTGDVHSSAACPSHA